MNRMKSPAELEALAKNPNYSMTSEEALRQILSPLERFLQQRRVFTRF